MNMKMVAFQMKNYKIFKKENTIKTINQLSYL